MTLFDAQVALDPVTNELVKDGALTIYAEDDTTFTTPLAITDLSGLPLTSVSTSPTGVAQGFNTVQDHLVVVARSGPYAITLRSALGTAQRAADLVNDATGANADRAEDAADRAEAAAAGGGSGGGTTDHGLLNGLGDDDHPQYLNATRGDARYVRTVNGVAPNASGNVTVSGGGVNVLAQPTPPADTSAIWVDTSGA